MMSSVSPCWLIEKKEIKSRTVKISCKRACKAADVLQSIKGILPLECVEAIGTHGRNSEHFVTFFRKGCANTLLSHRLEIAGSQAFVNAVDREEVTVRVHWLPYWCDNTILEKRFNKYGQVLKIVDEKGVTLDKEGAHIASAVRIVTLVCKDDTKHHIPHIVKIEGKDVLLTIRGRPPLCQKCKNQDI